MEPIKEIKHVVKSIVSGKSAEPPESVIPILVFPGFMSSSLEIAESSIRPNWVGKRIWLSLPRMGISSYNRTGGLWKPPKEDNASKGETRRYLRRFTQPLQEMRPLQERVPEHRRASDPPSLADVGLTKVCHAPTSFADVGHALFQVALDHDRDETDSQSLGHFEDADERKLGNAWCRHFVLRGPEDEAEGVHLRPVPGCAGIDYLSHESAPVLDVVMARATYVFSPVIKALKQIGFEKDKTLDAAAYDWRFAPSALQNRDAYFDRTIEQIEKMNSAGQGVALLGHSMGNKVVQYFLEHAKRVRGQEWIDTNVHTFIACGAPLLGAPQATRSFLHGERMGLESFLSKEEALVIGRSYSCTPWTFPIGSFVNVRRQGVLEIQNLKADLPLGCLKSSNNAAVLGFEVSWDIRKAASKLDSQASIRLTQAKSMLAEFDNDSNMLQFGGPSTLPPAAAIRVVVKEKGAHLFDLSATGSRDLLNRAVGEFIDGTTKFRQSLQHSSDNGTSPFAVARVATGYVNLASLRQRAKDKAGFVSVSLPLTGGVGTVSFSLRWLDFEEMCLAWMGEDWCPISFSDASHVRHCSESSESYVSMDAPQLFAADGCQNVLDVWTDYYLEDPLFDATGCNDAPPVRRVLAVHGTNSLTEIGFVLKVDTFRRKTSKAHTRFCLDDAAELVPGVAPSGWSLSGGILFHSGTVEEPSGDGSVPIESLEHCNAWKDKVDVTIVRIPNAGHREMLADKRFHQVLIDSFGGKRLSEETPEMPLLSCISDNNDLQYETI